ncbi:MAG: 3-hydroxyacyl-ACP dehydratase FabZ [Thermodesulfobacterium sp.]|nr:3-hydroxyacyl-ACP dehydratase FabZ [Thermodesulfobacterium sp.]
MKREEMGINFIKDILPHRFPFLMIDKIVEVDEEKQYVKAIKNVTINEPFFSGHFPDYPIMPGVLIIEAMAQAAAAGMKVIFPDYKEKLFVLAGIDKVKFRHPVYPGDTLVIEAQGFKKKGYIVKTNATAKVGEKVVAEAEITAGIIKKEKKDE